MPGAAIKAFWMAGYFDAPRGGTTLVVVPPPRTSPRRRKHRRCAVDLVLLAEAHGRVRSESVATLAFTTTTEGLRRHTPQSQALVDRLNSYADQEALTALLMLER